MQIDNIKLKVALFNKFSSIPITILSQKNNVIYNSFDMKHTDELSIFPHYSLLKFDRTSPGILTFHAIEVYGFFSEVIDNNLYFFLIGPILTVRPVSYESIQLLSFSKLFDEASSRKYIKMIPLLPFPNIIHFIELLYFDISSKHINYEEIFNHRIVIESKEFKEDSNINLCHEKSNHDQEYSLYEEIMKYYDAIKAGDLTTTNQLLNQQILINYLTKQNLKNNLYYIISISSLLAKASVDSGVEYKDAESFSFTLIGYAETCEVIEDFIFVLKKMVLGFASLVNDLKNEQRFSKPVNKAISYIDKHLHFAITLEEISSHVKLSKPYLSQLFSKEVGNSLQIYVQLRKIEEAKNLLSYTKISISEISQILAFCSQSYFTEVFKKATSYTPVSYRKKYRKSK
ncbi:MAG: AraC family transcriptional regulator [Firmicutes bacterium]|nr:AraC family transcriptional regulator [Bacillota bacterium]